jgi:streptogramin lyase
MAGRNRYRGVGARRRLRPVVEGMETRQLMAVSISSYNVPTSNSGLIGITKANDGNLWFTEFSAGKIGMINPTTKAITEFSTPTANSGPYEIATGPDGNLWFTEFYSGQIGTINLSTHVITEFSVGVSAGPQNLVSGPDGNIWFTDPPSNKVGVMTTSGQVTEFTVPAPNGAPSGTQVYPQGITKGSDNKLWFTTGNTDEIGSINPTTKAISLYPIPSSSFSTNGGKPTDNPQSITTGPDGKLWFTETLGNRVGTLDPTNPTAISEFTIPTANSLPEVITTGPDGNLWFAEFGANKIGTINPSSHVFTEYTVFGPGANNPFWLTLGPDNNVWFTFGSPANRQIGEAQLIPVGQGAITSNVTFDASANGTGAGMAGRTVYLDLNNNGVLDAGDPTAVTGISGFYTFSGLTPGSYTVRLVTYAGDLTTRPFGAAQTVQVNGGQLTTPATFGLIPTTVISPIVVNASPFGTHNVDIYTAEMNGLYHLLLGRAPDSVGLAQGVLQLKAGVPLQQVVVGFFYQPEYQSRAVAGYYQSYLGRTASPAEINANVAALQAGMNQEQLSASFLTSAEFNARHADNSDFVRTAYQVILGRAASGAEVTGVVNLLNSGTSRTVIIGTLLGSTEAETRAANGYYGTILGRPGDTPGLNAAVYNLQHGLSKHFDVAAFLVGSPEYVARARATVG